MEIPVGARTRELKLRGIRLLVALGAALCLAVLGITVVSAQAGALTQSKYLSLAQQGIGKASAWANRRYHWYNEVLGDRKKYPQATVWGLAPLFESEAFTAIGSPTSANVARLKAFANHAEKYLDPHIAPAPGVARNVLAFAPYPGSHTNQKTFFDDNAWWSLGFMDAYTAMQKVHNAVLAARYLADAVRGFDFIYPNSWDTHDAGGPDSVRSTRGGVYWNTYHVIPGGMGRSGEALASATELAAELYRATGAHIYLSAALRYITWANQNLLKWDGSYALRIPHEVTMPHDGEGAMIGAFTALCESKAGTVPSSVYSFLPRNKTHSHPSFRRPDHPSSWCSWAEALARHTAFGVNPGGGVQDKFFPLNEGPQWDAIYVRGLLSLYGYDHRGTWYHLAARAARQIIRKARLSNGEYLKSWTGSSHVPGSAPGMLRTHAASVSVLADLASVAAR
jgi:glycosyl hydrolase family 76